MMKSLLTLFFLGICLAAYAQTGNQTENLIEWTLKDLYKSDIEKGFLREQDRRYLYDEYDLDDNGKKEILVYLGGSYFCGTGGCTLLLMDHEGNVITSFSVTDTPVIYDSKKTNGWRNLFIQTGGKFHVVKFDGRKYPSNPSVQPVLTLTPGDSLPRGFYYPTDVWPWRNW